MVLPAVKYLFKVPLRTLEVICLYNDSVIWGDWEGRGEVGSGENSSGVGSVAMHNGSQELCKAQPEPRIRAQNESTS